MRQTNKYNIVRRHFFLGTAVDFWFNGLEARMEANDWRYNHGHSFPETQRIYLASTDKNPLLWLERQPAGTAEGRTKHVLRGLLLAAKTGQTARQVYSFCDEIQEATFEAMLHQSRRFASCKNLPSYNISRSSFYSQYQVTAAVGARPQAYSHMYAHFDKVTRMGRHQDGVYAVFEFHFAPEYAMNAARQADAVLYPDNNDAAKVLDRVLPPALGDLSKLDEVDPDNFYLKAVKRRHTKFPW